MIKDLKVNKDSLEVLDSRGHLELLDPLEIVDLLDLLVSLDLWEIKVHKVFRDLVDHLGTRVLQEQPAFQDSKDRLVLQDRLDQ